MRWASSPGNRVRRGEASKPSSIFVVKKKSFDDMLSDNGDVRATVYKNIIDVLSEKLNNDNIRMRDHQLEKSENESRLLGF